MKEKAKVADTKVLHVGASPGFESENTYSALLKNRLVTYAA